MNAGKAKGLTAAQRRYLHWIKRNNKLSDNAYRALLLHAAGVRSSTELSGGDLSKVLDAMESVGLDIGERIQPAPQHYGERQGMATAKQLDYLDGLRRRVFGDEAPPYFCWLEHYFKVSRPRFLTKGTAVKVIEGLKAMDARTAGNHDNGEGNQ